MARVRWSACQTPALPWRKVTLPWPPRCSVCCTILFSLPPAYEISHFAAPGSSFLSARWDVARFRNHWNKLRSLKCTPLNFVFNICNRKPTLRLGKRSSLAQSGKHQTNAHSGFSSNGFLWISERAFLPFLAAGPAGGAESCRSWRVPS